MAHDAPEGAPDTLIRDVAIVLGIIAFIYASNNITDITPSTIVSGEAPAAIFKYVAGYVPLETVTSFFLAIQGGLAVLSLVFFAGAVWATLKIKEIHHKEHEKYKPVKFEETQEAMEKFIPWHIITDHMNSENPAEWKLAILEADNMLDEVLDDMGYTGDTVAEKLKAVGGSKLASYQGVWEAHKVRNEIAHGEMRDVELSSRMARETIAKFENAFKELGYL